MNFSEAIKSGKWFKLPEFNNWYRYSSSGLLMDSESGIPATFSKILILREDWMVKPEPEKEYKLEEVNWKRFTEVSYLYSITGLFDLMIDTERYDRIHLLEAYNLICAHSNSIIYWRPSPQMVEVKK